MIGVYTQSERGQQWLQQYRGRQPILACILGFTDTGLIPGISAAGATPADRRYTAIADAEFLVNGVTPTPQYPLPPLSVGASPVFISRAVVEALKLPVYVFNAGLPQPPAVPVIDLGGVSAQCLSSGNALPLHTVKHLFEQGLQWGKNLADVANDGYVILSECVVGGTTTALSILTGLGIAAAGKVNSSHPSCNHAQKWDIVQSGFRKWRDRSSKDVAEQIDHLLIGSSLSSGILPIDPFQLVAALGDPMQIAGAGITLAASQHCGVLLAGGTQMLAVYALARALACTQPQAFDEKKSGGVQEWQQDLLVSSPNPPINSPLTSSSSILWQPERIAVGTTRWVAQDPTGDTVGLALDIGDVPLLGTQLSFAKSRYPQLQAYEQGYVKEGVGAGGCAIAAYLYQGWSTEQLLQAIEALIEQYCQD
jgi:uncharacterized protein (TIGR00303 family)